MKSLYALLLSGVLIAGGSCKKPVLEVDDGTIPPMVLTTSIHDSLPLKTIKAIHLEGLTGLKVQYFSGLYSNYFEYHADKNVVLQALSELPVPMNANFSDTQCRSIGSGELEIMRRNISKIEVESAAAFWTDDELAEIFECIKPPYRHILKVSRDSREIHHRIELLEQS